MFESKINRGRANGYAPLDGSGKVPLDKLPPIQSTIDTGSFATTGSNTFTGTQTIVGTSNSLTIKEDDILYGQESFIIAATGSANLLVTSNNISLFGVTELPDVEDLGNNASLFANVANTNYGGIIAGGPVASILTIVSGSMPNYWFFDSSGSSFLPGDVNIGYSDALGLFPTSGSLNVRNGNINVSGSTTITGNNGRLIYRGTALEVNPTLAEIHVNNDTPWLEKFYNDTFSTSSAIMAYFGWNDGRFVFHNESTQSIGLQVNGYSGENGLLVYSDKVAFVNNVEISDSLNVNNGNINVSGSVYFGSGSSITETSSSIIITPAGAAAGQSLVIRPTAGQFFISSSHPDGFVPGESTSIYVGTYFENGSGTLDYQFTGATAQQLGRATTGILTFSSESEQTLTWNIPAQSSMTTFTFSLISGSGFSEQGGIWVNSLPNITVTLDGSAVSENNHIHLVSGDPSMVDIYLGDDDNYIKVEKNAGDIVIGTNLDTHHWRFDTSGSLTTPGDIVLNGSLIQQVNYAPMASGSWDSVPSEEVTQLDIAKDIHLLDTTGAGFGANFHWYLPDGYDGQVVRFALKGDGDTNPSLVKIWMNNIRTYNGTIVSSTTWHPFWDDTSGSPRSLATALFIDGAWNIDTDYWDM